MAKCDKCGGDGDVRLAGELLGPDIRQACRSCLGIWTTNWFYMRRPGDFDDDGHWDRELIDREPSHGQYNNSRR